MNQATSLRPAGALSADRQPAPSLVVFLADELLPEMTFNWPNGANRIEQNLQGAAQVYARQLSGKGFTPALIRAALQAELDSGRDFMPTPIQLANRCQQLQGGSQGSRRAPATRSISPVAVRMIAESRLWCDGRLMDSASVEREVEQVTQAYQGKGVQISGGCW